MLLALGPLRSIPFDEVWKPVGPMFGTQEGVGSGFLLNQAKLPPPLRLSTSNAADVSRVCSFKARVFGQQAKKNIGYLGFAA